MYDFLLGLSFDEVVSELNERGVKYDFGEQLCYEDAKECEEIYIGGLWSDSHYDVEFEDGVVVELVEFEGWD